MHVKQLPQTLLNYLPFEIWEKIEKIIRDHYLKIAAALTHKLTRVLVFRTQFLL